MNKYYCVAIFLCILSWSFVTHPFEIPDEQSHYATVHYLVEQGRMPTYQDKKNLSLEEQEAQYILGIMTDGTNKYMYHPEYRMEYVGGLVGKYEADLKSLNTAENRSTYTIHQAAIYPPLYYWFAALFYRMVGGGDIILRLFTTRLASVLMTTALVAVAYQIGRLLYKKESYARALALMTLFYPMTTYIGSGVNSDNLHNLLYAIFIYLTLRLIKNGWDTRLSISLGAVIGLDLLTKPQAYIMLPILGLAVLLRTKWSEWRQWLSHAPLIVAPVLALAGWQEIPKFVGGGVGAYAADSDKYGGADNFVRYAKEYFHRASAAMVVWYWGVFKWLGVTIPRPFWWLANRLMLLAAVGIIIRFFGAIRKRRLSFATRAIIFAIGANVIYVGALFWFDWQFYQEYGRSLGMQARYYMPLLVLQLHLLLIGVTSLGWSKTIKKWLLRGLVLFFLTLQLAGIYTLVSIYYDLWPLTTLISQMSQYKPDFTKGDWWYLWGGLYIVSVLYLTYNTIFAPSSKPSKVKSKS